MYNRTKYIEDCFSQILHPEENYNCYFYVMSFAPFADYLLYQQFALFLNKHMIVSFTDKRILVCEMDPAGNLTGNVMQIEYNDVQNVSVKRGFMKTTIQLTFRDNSKVQFKPNNVCIGLPKHKENLLKLTDIFKH